MNDEISHNSGGIGWEPIYGASLYEAYYDIIDKVPNKCWKEFARTGLGINDSVIDDICHDERHNVREQKFQMCRKWGERECIDDGEVDDDHLEIITDTMKYLYQILNHFLLGKKYPKPERKNVSKRKRFKRNYCYRVSKLMEINCQKIEGSFLNHYETASRRREAVIFNNTFKHSDKFFPRLGTECDVENMKNLWKELGCNVTVHIDLTAIDMTNKLKDYASKWHDIDYCVIIIMSHGDKGDVIYGESFEARNSVPISDIVDIFNATNAKSLAGIPKLFFFECSRGGKVGSMDYSYSVRTEPNVARPSGICRSYSEENPSRKRMKRRSGGLTRMVSLQEESLGQTAGYPRQNYMYSNPSCQLPACNIPPLSDMLICFATTPGYSSFRDPRNGSWFMNAVANVFKTHACQQHVVGLMMKVGEAMSENTASEKHATGLKCISHFECTLTKELYLAATRSNSEDLQSTKSAGGHDSRYQIALLENRIDKIEKSMHTDVRVGGASRLHQASTSGENFTHDDIHLSTTNMKFLRPEPKMSKTPRKQVIPAPFKKGKYKLLPTVPKPREGYRKTSRNYLDHQYIKKVQTQGSIIQLGQY